MTTDAADAQFLKTLTLLYVEDDPATRVQAVRYLERRLGRVVVAEHGQQGLDLYRSESPDLVASDVQMPFMDGLAMAAAIRADDPHTPIILLTAFETVDYLRRAIDIGVEQYVLKPMEPRLLERALHQASRRLRLEHELAVAHRREVEAIEARERSLSELVDSSAVGIAVVDDSTGRVLRVNAGLCRILGYDASELVGADWRVAMKPAEVSESERWLRRFSQGEISAIQLERTYLRKDGTSVATIATVTPLPATKLQPTARRLVVIADITPVTAREQLRLQTKDHEISRLTEAAREQRLLPLILSQCVQCKDVHDDRDTAWRPLAAYLSKYTSTMVSHGLCPTCARSLYPELLG